MRISTMVASLAALLATWATPAAAMSTGLPADASNGQAIAERLCSSCHAVGAGNGSTRADVPPFITIANLPGQTPERVAGRIIVPHPEMPSVQLTISEIRDVVAYILSLRSAQDK